MKGISPRTSQTETVVAGDQALRLAGEEREALLQAVRQIQNQRKAQILDRIKHPESPDTVRLSRHSRELQSGSAQQKNFFGKGPNSSVIEGMNQLAIDVTG